MTEWSELCVQVLINSGIATCVGVGQRTLSCGGLLMTASMPDGNVAVLFCHQQAHAVVIGTGLEGGPGGFKMPAQPFITVLTRAEQVACLCFPSSAKWK